MRTCICTILIVLIPSLAGADEPLVLKDHAGWVGGMAFSPDAKTLATASADKLVSLWDMPAGRLHLTLKGHTDIVSAVAFAPDGRSLASAGFDGTVRVWDAATGEERRVLRDHRGAVLAVAFSPDGKTLASGGLDGIVRLWDAAEGRLQASATGHKTWVNALAWSADGKHLATASSDGTVRLWSSAGKDEKTFHGAKEDGEVALGGVESGRQDGRGRDALWGRQDVGHCHRPSAPESQRSSGRCLGAGVFPRRQAAGQRRWRLGSSRPGQGLGCGHGQGHPRVGAQRRGAVRGVQSGR